ncbi:Flp family type IVb pilin [Caballeronia sp. LZ062]|uniref:Flp family type IVb pilin n=1 Tax=unclassified Caballeronia TaxID=2646786 RepID=UPI002862B6EB|nr:MULTISPECIES: Flp family type IVb pilin [unclassified Caballeronia]MDR5857617.1 Flp family type IVb pilin [Caballeronia sp. LZ050]MDR5869167.1 Flp family type IVb pilin [Caballeronia sp. LZ062]
MLKFAKAFTRDERGVSAMEYAILAGIIVVALTASMTTFKTAFTGLWTTITSDVTKAGK